jgi:hypothetical protein
MPMIGEAISVPPALGGRLTTFRARAGASCCLPSLARKELPGRIRRIEAPNKALGVERKNGEIATAAARRPRDCGDLNELAWIRHFNSLSLYSLPE